MHQGGKSPTTTKNEYDEQNGAADDVCVESVVIWKLSRF